MIIVLLLPYLSVYDEQYQCYIRVRFFCKYGLIQRMLWLPVPCDPVWKSIRHPISDLNIYFKMQSKSCLQIRSHNIVLTSEKWLCLISTFSTMSTFSTPFLISTVGQTYFQAWKLCLRKHAILLDFTERISTLWKTRKLFLRNNFAFSTPRNPCISTSGRYSAPLRSSEWLFYERA